MISRRLLRVKALHTLYAFNRKEGDDMADAGKELILSIGKAYDLYLYMLQLYVELSDIADEKIETSLHKNIPSWDDLNPNRRFSGNRVIAALRENREFAHKLTERKISWNGYNEIPRVLYNKMTQWEGYSEYLKSPDDSLNNDRKFLNILMTGFLLESDDLLSHLEERSIYWNDDFELAVIMIEKTLKKVKDGSAPENLLMPLYKNEDDERFAGHLLNSVLLKNEVTRKIIDSNTTNWEIERIALMDILVMQLAITEIMVFPEIPVKVTLNEYIEIAKYYCTSKSSTFINGILDKVVKEMKSSGMFEKAGRGLVGENEND